MAVSFLRPLWRVPTVAWSRSQVATQSWRFSRSYQSVPTGFFKDDETFIDPDGPLYAERKGSKWRLMDDPTLQSTVLERNNVGMGMLVLNRSQGFDLPTINDLYTRLRNLEVNSLKRFVGLAASDSEASEHALIYAKSTRELENFDCSGEAKSNFSSSPFGEGIDLQELMLAATVAKRADGLAPFSRALLWNFQEMAHLVADYRKPLITQIHGSARNGAAMACLANSSGVYEDSELVFDAAFAGLGPMGGVSRLLARASKKHQGLGEFLALTRTPIRGVGIVNAGMAKYWISPEALPYLELTAETHLRTTEERSRFLLEDHFLNRHDEENLLGDVFGRRIKEEDVLYVIANCFGSSRRGQKGQMPITTVKDVMNQLKKVEKGEEEFQDKPEIIRKFARDCLDRMGKACPRACARTFKLIRDASALEQTAESAETEESLQTILKKELNVQDDLLRHAHSVENMHAFLTKDGRKGIMSRRKDEWKDLVQIENENTDQEDKGRNTFKHFFVMDRSEFSLSTHPRLRRYHPDYNPETGLDHDAQWMADEAKRWNPGLFEIERQNAINELIGAPQDNWKYGQARFSI